MVNVCLFFGFFFIIIVILKNKLHYVMLFFQQTYDSFLLGPISTLIFMYDIRFFLNRLKGVILIGIGTGVEIEIQK